MSEESNIVVFFAISLSLYKGKDFSTCPLLSYRCAEASVTYSLSVEHTMSHFSPSDHLLTTKTLIHRDNQSLSISRNAIVLRSPSANSLSTPTIPATALINYRLMLSSLGGCTPCACAGRPPGAPAPLLMPPWNKSLNPFLSALMSG